MAAYRDMTEAQFRAALKRNGFTLIAGSWVEHKDFPNSWFGLILDPRTFKVRRRTSLSHALRKLDELRAKQKAAS